MKKRTLKKYFDKIYIINYIEAHKRRENIINMFTHYGLIDDIEFIYGIPYNKIRALVPYLENVCKDSKTTGFGGVTIPGIGCSLSHYTAVKTAYELGANSVLIIEDDAILRDDMDMIFDYLDNIPEDWDYLYFTPEFNYININIQDLNLFMNSKNKWINLKNFYLGSNNDAEYIYICLWTSSGCYALNRKGMELYLRTFEVMSHMKNSDMLEYFYHNISQSPLNMYTTNRRLFAFKTEFNVLKYNKETNKYEFSQKHGIPNSIEITPENFKFPCPNEESSFIWNSTNK